MHTPSCAWISDMWRILNISVTFVNTGDTEDKQRSATGGEDKNAYSVPTIFFPSSPIWAMSNSPKACHY